MGHALVTEDEYLLKLDIMRRSALLAVKKIICTVYNFVFLFNSTTVGVSPGVLGIWGEGLFIFRELRSTGNYFRGARKQPHNFRESYTKVKKKNLTVKVNPPFCLIFSSKFLWFHLKN